MILRFDEQRNLSFQDTPLTLKPNVDTDPLNYLWFSYLPSHKDTSCTIIQPASLYLHIHKYYQWHNLNSSLHTSLDNFPNTLLKSWYSNKKPSAVPHCQLNINFCHSSSSIMGLQPLIILTSFVFLFHMFSILAKLGYSHSSPCLSCPCGSTFPFTHAENGCYPFSNHLFIEVFLFSWGLM